MEEKSAYQFCALSVVACIFLTCSYVASLYVWRSTLSRDHPTTIKRRFFSVSVMMLIAYFFSYYFMSSETLSKGNYNEQLGLRWAGIFYASTLPLILTVVLFLGPLTMCFFSGTWKMYLQPMYWVSCWQDLMWVRNQIMAPLSEEWVFRACMMPILLQCFIPMTAVFIGPLLFGIAHFHHMYEHFKSGFDFKTALFVSTFQFTYTSLFGAYSSFIFARTGHFVAPLFAHMFCNHMGFPNLSEIRHHRPLHQVIIIFNFFLGFTLWCFLLNPLTDPLYYDNVLHWTS